MRDLVEVVGFALVIAFCVVVWWPSALLVGGLGLIVWAAFPARGERTERRPSVPVAGGEVS